MPESSKRSRASTASNDEESNTKRQCRTTEGVRCSLYMIRSVQEGSVTQIPLQLILKEKKIKDLCICMASYDDEYDDIEHNAYILFQNGNLKKWGKVEDYPYQMPGKIPNSIFLDQVMQIACSSLHAIAVKRDGSVWTWGNGARNGRLGRQTIASDPSSPGQVVGLQDTKIQKVACGSHASFALSSTGALYSWGHNSANGHGGSLDGFISAPKIIQPLPPMKDIVTRNRAAGTLTTDGKVFTWGLKAYSGHHTGPAVDENYDSDTLINDKTVGRPTILSAAMTDGEIVQLSCGYTHMAALSKKRSVFAWGMNDHGQRGEGDAANSLAPALVEGLMNEKIVQVSCGTFYTAALSDEGEIFTW